MQDKEENEEAMSQEEMKEWEREEMPDWVREVLSEHLFEVRSGMDRLLWKLEEAERNIKDTQARVQELSGAVDDAREAKRRDVQDLIQVVSARGNSVAVPSELAGLAGGDQAKEIASLKQDVERLTQLYSVPPASPNITDGDHLPSPAGAIFHRQVTPETENISHQMETIFHRQVTIQRKLDAFCDTVDHHGRRLDSLEENFVSLVVESSICCIKTMMLPECERERCLRTLEEEQSRVKRESKASLERPGSKETNRGSAASSKETTGSARCAGSEGFKPGGSSDPVAWARRDQNPTTSKSGRSTHSLALSSSWVKGAWQKILFRG